MFEFIRTHQRLMQFVLLLIIFPSFAFFGLEGYTRFRGDHNALATVDGQPITKEQVDEAHRQQVERLRQMFGGQLDARMFDTPEARRTVLDGLIAQRSLQAAVQRDRLVVPDQVLQAQIMGIPGLTGEDGKFDMERYKSLLAAQGMNPSIFEARMRQDLALQQLNQAISDTSIAPKSVTGWLADVNEQERLVQEMRFAPADYMSKVKITDDMLKDYYEKNPLPFEVPEQAKAEYVVLSPAVVASQISVSDADIKSYYDQNQKRFHTDEQRRASHILIAVPKSASAEQRKAAQEKAAKLLEQVRKNPADFAKVAKANSQDPGSAEKGGDLGFFAQGSMVKPFEEAAFKLKKGEISDLVQSDYGYHIIMLTDIKPARTKSLDEVKDEISAEIKKQLAAKKFSEMADTFSNTVYEQADSLKPVADKLGLKIETVSNLTRQGNQAAPQALYNNPKFLNTLFSDDAIRNKRNTEAVEVAPSTLIAGRIVEYKPASKKPFDQVKAQVQDLVTRREAAALAKKAGEEKLAELKAKPEAAANFGPVKTVSRVQNKELPGQAAAAVLKADVSKLPAFAGAELGAEGYGVYRINKVQQPATPDENRRKAQAQQFASAMSQEEMMAYVDAAKAKAKVKINKQAEGEVASKEQPAK